MYTMNKLYNILKIAPLKSYRGHFISASWMCQPQLISRTAHVECPQIWLWEIHMNVWQTGHKSHASLLKSQEQSQPSSTIVAYEVKSEICPIQNVSA